MSGGLAVAALALLAALQAANGQSTEPSAIEVDGIGPLVTDPVSFRQVETFLAVNPTDPTNMIATALADSEDGGLAYVTRDGGETWSGPHRAGVQIMSANTGGRSLHTLLGTGGTAVDESGGKFDGTVYMTWNQVVDGHLQPVLARSRDGGRTWSSPVRVNRGGRDSHHSTPHVAVGPEGVVAVTWNDRRHDPEDQCYHHYVAISRDGGQSFSSERRISEQETCLPPDYRWQNGGDTQGLVALPDGSFRAVWSGPGPNGPRPWTAEVRVD